MLTSIVDDTPVSRSKLVWFVVMFTSYNKMLMCWNYMMDVLRDGTTRATSNAKWLGYRTKYVYSITYDGSFYNLTFWWWSIGLTYNKYIFVMLYQNVLLSPRISRWSLNHRSWCSFRNIRSASLHNIINYISISFSLILHIHTCNTINAKPLHWFCIVMYCCSHRGWLGGA